MSKSRADTRHAGRQRAFQVLYGLAFAPVQGLEGLRRAFAEAPDGGDGSRAPSGFAWDLVEGVWRQAESLDETIGRYSRNWRVDRMGKVELTLLRLAVFELLHRPDVPPKVVINEALELGRQFGEDRARAFVNGILDAVAKTLENGTTARPAAAASARGEEA